MHHDSAGDGGARSLLVIGGQRSGKSRHAEATVAGSGLAPVYIATATSGDDEMRQRIAAHRDRRGAAWRTVEEPLDLAGALRREAADGRFLLVECLTLWLSNLYGAGRDSFAEMERLAATLPGLPGRVALVTNEVGSGVIPDNALARAYADALGGLNQTVAAVVDSVVLVVAGQPLVIKQPATQRTGA